MVISDTIGPQNLGWVGKVADEEWGIFVDVYLLIIFGGIPWQVGVVCVVASWCGCRLVVGVVDWQVAL